MFFGTDLLEHISFSWVGFLYKEHRFHFLIIIILTIGMPVKVFADESSDKSLQILNGWGDRLFSIFGDAIEDEQRHRQDMIDKLAGEDGELTNEEIRKFRENEAALNEKEEHRAMEQLRKMYDVENGVFSGLFKAKQKIEEKRSERAVQIDQNIAAIITGVDKIGIKKTVLKLRTVHWIPIGHDGIDKKMSEHYANLIQDLIAELKTN